MPFAMYQTDSFFISASLGYQQLQFDTRAVSSANASIWSVFIETGYTWLLDNVIVEPFVNVESTDIHVDEFLEDDLNNDAFDLFIEE